MVKKSFLCGHKGKGQYCHRCEHEKFLQKKELQRKEAKNKWKDLFNGDPIDLRPLNTKGLVEKARALISEIHSGASYTRFKGKRMQFDRKVISVPLNRDWRIIFHYIDGQYCCRKLMSHEEYNVRKPGEKN